MYSQVAAPSPLVLVVEDDADTLAMYECCLEQSGFRVAEAMTAFSALRMLSETVPDVVLADIGLPGMDGVEFCRRLRQHPVAHSTPAVAVTGWAMATDLQRAREAGYNSVLVKPCDPAVLVQEIHRLLPPISHSR